MQTVSEIDRLKDVYHGYAERGLVQSKWSLANAGNQAIWRERHRRLSELLAGARLLPLARQRILDVGCGTGDVLASFQDWGAAPENLFGVDLLAERIQVARERFPGMTFQHANAEALSFTDGFFDMVSLFTVFTSVLDDRMAFNISREIERVLAPKGVIIWYDFRVGNPFNPHVRGIPQKGIQALFPGFHAHLRALTLVPPLARRLGAATSCLYPCLAALPFCKTHYLGVLTRR
jgi:ubiquinone/menaquinone biosynthesis C-methylase UbiE